MYNESLRGIEPKAGVVDTVDAANVEFTASQRNYRVAAVDLGTIGLDQCAQSLSVCYIGTENHPHLPPCNPAFSFDNQDLDRLISVTVNREWMRQDYEPRRGILVMGPTGSGKTTYLRERFARQGIPVAEITWQADMEAVEAVYTREAIGGDTVYSDGALLLAARGGYPVIINEIDTARPSQLVALNEIIDNGTIVIPQTGEVVQAKRGFAVFATCNSTFVEDRSGAYAGTRSQNVSVQNRFFKFVLDYPSEGAEKAFILSQFPGLDENQAGMFARFVTLVRTASNPLTDGLRVGTSQVRLSLPFSRRTLLDWLGLNQAFAELAKRQISVPKYALKPVYTAGLPDNEVASVEHLLDMAFGIVPDDVA